MDNQMVFLHSWLFLISLFALIFECGRAGWKLAKRYRKNAFLFALAGVIISVVISRGFFFLATFGIQGSNSAWIYIMAVSAVCCIAIYRLVSGKLHREEENQRQIGNNTDKERE